MSMTKNFQREILTFLMPACDHFYMGPQTGGEIKLGRKQ